MNLVKLKSGIYELDMRSTGGPRVSTGKREYAEAVAVASKILKGTHKKSSEILFTMSDALDHTWNDIWKDQKQADSQAYTVEIVRRKFGDIPAASMTYGLVNEWVKACKLAGKAPSTINSYLSCISRALRHAGDLSKLQIVPRMPRLPVSNNKIRFITPHEEVLILKSTESLSTESDVDVMGNLIVALLYTGCRLSEIIRARPDEYTPRQFLIPDSKNGKPRSVPMLPEAFEALKALFSNEQWVGMREDILDTTQSKSVRAAAKRRVKDWCVRRFTRIRNHAELPDVTLHTLRHTTASRLVQAGVDLYRVMTIMGHSSIEVTKRYAHLNVSHLAGDMQSLVMTGTGENVVQFNKRGK